MTVVLRNTLGVVDYIVIVVILLISIAIGIYFSLTGGHQRTTKEYLLADKKMNLLPVTLSLIVSYYSAISILGYPAEVFLYGSQLALFNISSIVSFVIVAVFFIPFIRGLRLVSAFQYVKRRYKSRAVQKLSSGLGILVTVFYLGTATYAPALAIEAVTGVPLWASIVVIMAVSTLYTSLGGMKAVLWTDALQFFIMIAGILVVLIKGWVTIGGPTIMWETSVAGQRANFFDFDPSPTTRHTFWGIVVGGTCLGVIHNCFSQANVQRISSVKSDRQARIALLAKTPFYLLLTIPLLLISFTVYTYYVQLRCNPVKEKIITSANQLLPHFVMEVMADLPGIPGLFVSSLLSGSLSSNSSSLNGIAALAWEDFFKDINFLAKRAEKTRALISKLTVVVAGCVGTAIAFLAAKMGGPIMQISLSLFGSVNGPLSGIFLLGALFPWANWIGAFTGGLCGIVMCAWTICGSMVHKVHSYSPPVPAVPSGGCFPGNASRLGSTLYNTSLLSYMSETVNSTVYYLEDTMSSVTLATATNSTEASLVSKSGPFYMGLDNLYAVSYIHYALFGVLTVLVVGMAVSAATGFTDPQDVDPVLILPFIRRFVYGKNYELKMKIDMEMDDTSISLMSGGRVQEFRDSTKTESST